MAFFNFSLQRVSAVFVSAGVLELAACSSTVLTPPPVEDRVAGQRGAASKSGSAAPSGVASTSAAASVPMPAASSARASSVVTPSAAKVTTKPLPGSENAGLPGYYTVKPGDTLIRIGLDQGQSWRDIARWNAIENINLIEVGQVLRVAPPGTTPSASGATPSPVTAVASATATASTPAKVESRPVEAKPPAPVPTPAAPSSSVASAASDEEITWMWPATGQVLSGFDEGRNVKGLAIGGKAGDPVLAAADGRVVYAGAGLRGYGNLVIVKHNATFLTAYAHNQSLLVKEDQAVRKGQKIAEMGSSDAERVQLHFEIRRMGKPVDPAKLLPAR